MTVPSTAARPQPPFSDQLCILLPDLRRKALSLTRNAAAADDLVQDTLERALRHQYQFLEGSNLRAWAMRIMTNRFISQRRRHHTERRVLERTAHDPNGWAGKESARQVPGLSPAVDRLLASLPARLKATVTLVDLEGESYRDAAEMLDVPVGTVMSRLHRARTRLASQLVDKLPVTEREAA